MISFALIGAVGYVAPRHSKAMQVVGGDQKVACDPNDPVGIVDSHFPGAHLFTEFERYDRHVDKLRRRGEKINCQKPLVLNPWKIASRLSVLHRMCKLLVPRHAAFSFRDLLVSAAKGRGA
jgi:UDP-N-acetyl-2-amino-2-deoxyglucuronate dehydrogenase